MAGDPVDNEQLTGERTPTPQISRDVILNQPQKE